MTNQPDPITPPPELVQQWYNECPEANEDSLPYVATQAANWGADQELEACCEWLKVKKWVHPELSDELRTARRPKPLSLKEQALENLKRFESSGDFFSDQMRELEFIRKALEQLDD